MSTWLAKVVKTSEVDVAGRSWLIYLYIFLGLLGSLLLSGLVYGWSSLILIFQQEGVYSELCQSTAPGSPLMAPVANYTVPSNSNMSVPVFAANEMCPEQELRFNFVFNIALLGNFVPTPLYGYIMDTYGARPTLLSGLACIIASFLFVAFGYHTSSTDLLIPGFTLMMTGGYGLILSLFTFSTLKAQYSSFIFAIYSVAFDSSPVVFYLYVKLYSDWPISPRTFFLVFLTVPVLFTLLAVLWPKGIGEPAKTANTATNDQKMAELELFPSTAAKSPETTSPNGSADDTPRLDLDLEGTATTTEPDDSQGVTLDFDSPTPSPAESSTSNDAQQVELDVTRESTPSAEPLSLYTSELGPTDLFDLPFKQQLLTKESLGVCGFHTVNAYWISTYMGSISSRLSAMDPSHGTDPEIAEKILRYTEAFGLVLSLVIFAAPIIGYAIYRLKLARAVLVNSILAILWSACKFVPSIDFQIVAFVIFVVLRAWYYSIVFNTVTQLFGWRNAGKIWGLWSVVAGLVALSFSGVSWCVVNLWNGSYLYPDIVEFLMMVATSGFGIMLVVRKARWEKTQLITTLPSQSAAAAQTTL